MRAWECYIQASAASGFAAVNQTLHSLAIGMSSYAVLESAENKRNQITCKELHKNVTGNMCLNIYTYAYVWFSPLRPGRKHEAPFLGCLCMGEVWGACQGVCHWTVCQGWGRRLGLIYVLKQEDHEFRSPWDWMGSAENKLKKQWKYPNLDSHCQVETYMKLMPTS